jgi:TPP-dependent pyruvate/acetoin dehydrogenase alpha subunit
MCFLSLSFRSGQELYRKYRKLLQVWEHLVFLVVDNGWAISVPSAMQTRSKSYGAKAKAYGMPGIKVDGNDLLAVHEVMSEALERARAGEPSFFEPGALRVNEAAAPEPI